MDRKDFGELIAALRDDLGWTQAQLAESRPKLYASTHAEHGSLSYHVFSAYNTTPHGELYLYQLVPTDERTTDVFEGLARGLGPHAHRLAPWPKKLIQD